MNNIKLQQAINLYIEERQDTILFQPDLINIEVLEEVITFITNDIKQKYQSDILHLRDQENQYYEPQEIVDFQRPHTFITVPHRQDVKTRTAIEDREIRNVYIVENDQVLIEKYKGKRKTETVTYKCQTIMKLNQQYLETLKRLLDNDNVAPKKRNSLPVSLSEPTKQIQQPESPKFGQSSKLREAGNDGISPSWILRKQGSNKVELKPYTLKQLAEHNQVNDAWICINQKIYDVTYYLDKHPGGSEKLMEGVGTDGTGLFNLHHPWVNPHYLLEKFQVGFLVNK